MYFCNTGVYTGSVYTGRVLAKYFPGEKRQNTFNDVIAVKDHLFHGRARPNYSRFIVVIRDPADAAKAEYTRQRARGQTKVLVQLDHAGES